MLALLLLVVFGLGMAFFATQNVLGTTITIAGNTFTGIPLYVVVIGSLLLGIFVSWLISMINAISSTLTIHGKDTALHVRDEQIAELKEKIHQLELDNATLGGEQHATDQTRTEESQEVYRPSIAQRVKHNLGFAA